MSHDKIQLLIVDDDENHLDLLSRMLEGRVGNVYLATSPSMALEILDVHKIDVVITDLQMPEMNGLDLGGIILEKDKNIPVILMTAYAAIENARIAIRKGFYDYILKPFEFGDMLSTVLRAIERRQLTLENEAYQKDLEIKIRERTRSLNQKLSELQARDTILSLILSVNDPEQTLKKALDLTLDLCSCDVGFLYSVDSNKAVKPCMSAGFNIIPDTSDVFTDENGASKNDNEVNENEDLNWAVDEAHVFRLHDDDLLGKVISNGEAFFVGNTDNVRELGGVHSICIIPIFRNGEINALVEVGRKDKSIVVNQSDIELLNDFLPYLSLAMLNSVLQKEMPLWENEADEILKATQLWVEK